jgi:regulatory protein
VIAGVVESLRAEHLLDDCRYVDNFVRSHAAKGQGPLRVRAALRQCGLPAELVETSIAAFPEWLPHLRAARQKKFGAALPTQYADKQRQARFLGYRGFTGAQIRTALGFVTDLDADNDEL